MNKYTIHTIIHTGTCKKNIENNLHKQYTWLEQVHKIIVTVFKVTITKKNKIGKDKR